MNKKLTVNKKSTGFDSERVFDVFADLSMVVLSLLVVAETIVMYREFLKGGF